jgi:hypothetical protein
MNDQLVEALQQSRKAEIKKLEHDLKLMEAQQQEDVSKEKAEVLRDSIDGARNALDVLTMNESCLRSPGNS